MTSTLQECTSGNRTNITSNSSSSSAVLPSSLLSVLSEGTSCNLQLLHQKSILDFEYLPRQRNEGGESPTSVLLRNQDNNNNIMDEEEGQRNHDWICHGTTVLYMIHHHAAPPDAKTNPTTEQQQPNQPQYRSLALHFRPSHSCQIEDLQVYTTTTTTNSNAYQLVPSSHVHHLHIDPLRKILRSSSSSSSSYEADTQLSRGGSGFATSLRAAGVASHDGEFKIAFSIPLTITKGHKQEIIFTPDDKQQLQEVWKKDLLQSVALSSSTDNLHPQQVSQPLYDTLQKNLHDKTSHRRNQRINLVSDLLSKASLSANNKNNNNNQLPLKIVIRWRLLSIPYNQQPLQRGLCIISSPSQTPHIYTTSSYTRGWLPCIDSYFIFGKSSHEMFLSITANQEEGLSIVSSGEDFVEDTVISYKKNKWKVTHMVASSTYEAIPCHCLGFAIGPFQFLLDPECISTGTTVDQEEEVEQVKEEVSQHQENEENPPDSTSFGSTAQDKNLTKQKKKKKKKTQKQPPRKRGIIRQVSYVEANISIVQRKVDCDYGNSNKET